MLLRTLLAAAAVAGLTVTELSAQPAIKIGGTAPLSGPAAVSGIAMKRSYEFVADEINRAGGISIDGQMRKVELFIEDCQSRPEVGVSAAQKLLTRDNVDILVSDMFHSSVALAVMELAPSFKNKLFYSGQPVSQEIAKKVASDKAKYGNFWKGSFNSDAYAQTTFESLKWLIAEGKIKEGNKKLAFVSEDTDYGKSNIEFMRPLFQKDGWTFTNQEMVPIGHADFFPQISKLRANAPDYLISIFTAANSGIAFVKQMREQGFKPMHFAIYYPTLVEFVRGAGEAGEGLLYSPLTFDRQFNPKHKVFAEKIDKFLGSETTGDHAFGVCNAELLMDAIKRAGSLNIAKLGDAFAKTDFSCPIGRFVFDLDTHSPKVGADFFPVPAAQIQDGQWRAIWPKAAATAEYRPSK
jgi:ABC-type branched-subunit amino acid transport system substrate-binding protein